MKEKLLCCFLSLVCVVFYGVQCLEIDARKELEDKLLQLEQETLPELYIERNVLIPRIVFQIWLGITSPTPELQYAHSCYHLNPSYKFVLFNGALVDHFLSTRVPEDLQGLRERYYQMDNYGEKSDLIRYLLLYMYGGIYTDLDVQCFKGFDGNDYLENLRNISNLVIPWEGDFPASMKSGVPIAKIRQASQFILFASAGGHPVLKAALQKVQSQTNKIQESDFLDVLYRSGPAMLTDAALGYLQNPGEWTVALMPIVNFNQNMGFGLPSPSPFAYSTHTTAFHKWTKTGEFSLSNTSRPLEMYSTPTIFKSKKYDAQPVWIGQGSLLVPLVGQLKTSYGRDVGGTILKQGFWPVYHDLITATNSLLVEILSKFENKQLIALGGDGAGYLPIKMALKGWSSKVYLGTKSKQLAEMIRKSAQINKIQESVEVKLTESTSADAVMNSLSGLQIPVVHFGELLSDMDADTGKDFIVQFLKNFSPDVILAEISPAQQAEFVPFLLMGAAKNGYMILHAGFTCEKLSVLGIVSDEIPMSPVSQVIAGQRVCSIYEATVWNVVKQVIAETMFPEIFIFLKKKI